MIWWVLEVEVEFKEEEEVGTDDLACWRSRWSSRRKEEEDLVGVGGREEEEQVRRRRGGGNR